MLVGTAHAGRPEGGLPAESNFPPMRHGARIATLVMIVAIAAIAVFAAVDRSRGGTPSATLVLANPASNSLFIVRRAPAGDPLHQGDRVAIDDPLMLAAYQLHALAAGSQLPLRRLSPAPQAALAEPVVPAPASTFAYVALAIQGMFLIVAALIAARGVSSGSLQLAWLFALVVTLVNPTSPAWPTWLIFVYAVGGAGLAVLAFACAADFASRFTGEGNAAWSRRFRRVVLASAIVAGIITFFVSYLTFATPQTPLLVQYAPAGALVVQSALFLVGLGLAFFKTRDAERQKARWVVLSLGVGIIGFVATVLLGVAGVTEPLRDLPLLLLIAMPLGCAYAILRYRLLDIAFVVNRATVFGVTSLLVLASLALVDFGLQNLLGSWLVRSGLYVQLGLALVIGIATRPLHGRVDRFVDDLFFRRRHEAERTLRQFVRDVAHIDSTGVVLQRTTETISRAAELQCALFMPNDDGYQCVETSGGAHERSTVDRNDGAVLRMLATHDPVDLHDVQTELSGDFAFPMFARDRLLGLLVCSGKVDGITAYAPDELDAISAVADAAGFALDLLRIVALERELEALRARLASSTIPTTLRPRRLEGNL